MKNIGTLALVILLAIGCKKDNTVEIESDTTLLSKVWMVDDSQYIFNNKNVTIYNRKGDPHENAGDLSDFRLQLNTDKTFKLVQGTGSKTGTWEYIPRSLKLIDGATLKYDQYAVDELDNNRLTITQKIEGSTLSKGDISYLNTKYEVDASKGYSVQLKLIH